MGLYNKSFCKLDINLNEIERINEHMVTNSFIYKYRDMIIKKYWYCTEYAISDNVFDILCNIGNKHFMKLYEMFTIISDEEYEEKYSKYKQGKIIFSKSGYTAKYYQQDSINPILEQSNYLSKNIEELKELVDVLSNSRILMSDTKIENAIIQKSGIVIIDPDYYNLSNLDIDFIKKNNYKELLHLLKTIFIYYSKFKELDILDYFIKLDNNDPFDSIYEIEKSLKKVKRPIDLIK